MFAICPPYRAALFTLNFNDVFILSGEEIDLIKRAVEDRVVLAFGNTLVSVFVSLFENLMDDLVAERVEFTELGKFIFGDLIQNKECLNTMIKRERVGDIPRVLLLCLEMHA